MTAVKGTRGRIIAPIDRVLDPSRGTLGGGGVLRPGAGRARATDLPYVQPGIGDFGPLLYWHADDATETEWPNRTALYAPLTPADPGSLPTIGSTWWGGSAPVVVLTGGSTVCLRTPDLSHLFASIGIDTFEIAIACSFADPLSGALRRILSTDESESVPSAGRVTATVTALGNAEFERIRTPSIDSRRSCILPANTPRTLHFVVRRTGAATGAADLFVNGIGSNHVVSSSTSSPAFTGTRLYIGADLAGTMRAVGMSIREIAVYDRELTRAERIAAYCGTYYGLSAPVGPS